MKERYPRFVDALSDFDDCLTLTYLYATLPSDNQKKTLPSSKFIVKSKQLAASWGAYCATTSSITKQFVSIKGIYMEAVINSVTVRWIIPHAFTQFIPDDVDFRIMNTFFELYQVMFDFILYKLYNDIGVRYPLISTNTITSHAAGTTSAILGSHLTALTNAFENSSSGGTISNVVTVAVQQQLQQQEKKNDMDTKMVDVDDSKTNDRIKSVGDALKQLSDDDDDNNEDDDDDDEDDDDVDVSGPLKAALDRITEDEARSSIPKTTNGGKDDAASIIASDEAIRRRRLFHGLTFFISREVPRGYIELICLAYGAKAVGWENGIDSPISVKDTSITHHIIDRPRLPVTYENLPKSREYIQPQWILDCANFLFLLPVAKYTIGATLPPHLSPWVNDDEEGYKPAYAEEIERLKNGEVVEEDEEEENDNSMHDDSKPSIDTTKKVVEVVAAEDKGVEAEGSSSEEDDDEEIEHEEEEEEDEEVLKQKLERKRKKEEEETHQMAKSMMSRKASHLYGRMQHGIEQKKAKIDKLQHRRKLLEEDEEGNGTSSGRTWNREIIKGKEKNNEKSVLKMKVERLRKERKTIETTYDKTDGSMKKPKNRK